jgi:AcrR family transcriptional regulator
MMPRDAEQTRRRLLDAARDEFAAVGIAGARVDRIATSARSNKAQIYHYFGSKEGLFEAVFDDMVHGTLDEVPIDTDDLAEYAGRLFDSYEERPWVQRLATWYRLEHGEEEAIDLVVRSNRAKVDAVAAAQAAGRLPTTFTAEELLGLVLHTASLWQSSVPEYDALVHDVDRARRRAVVVAAAAAIVSA